MWELDGEQFLLDYVGMLLLTTVILGRREAADQHEPSHPVKWVLGHCLRLKVNSIETAYPLCR